MNLPVLHQYMDQLTGFPFTEAQAANPSLFVAGDLSDYLMPEHHAAITQLFPNSQFEDIVDAGHWLHAEQPARVFDVVHKFTQT